MRKLRPILRALTPAGWAVLVCLAGSVAIAVAGNVVLALCLAGFGAVLILT